MTYELGKKNLLRLGIEIEAKMKQISTEFLYSEFYPKCHNKRMQKYLNNTKGIHYRCLECYNEQIRDSCYKIYYDKNGIVQIKKNY